MNRTVKGLIIREMPVGESDKVLTVLAQNAGCISVWAKGARRMKSPLLAATQCFAYSELALFCAKDTYHVNQAELIDSFFDLRRDIDRLSLANYFAELAGCVVLEGSGDNSALSLTLNALHLLARSDKPLPLIKSVYELRLMGLAGYMPDIESCAVCEKPLTGGLFDCAGGVLYCEACAPKDAGLAAVPQSVHRAMTHILSAPHGKEFSFLLSGAQLASLSELCERFVRTHIDSKLKTLDFYNSLNFGGTKG